MECPGMSQNVTEFDFEYIVVTVYKFTWIIINIEEDGKRRSVC